MEKLRKVQTPTADKKLPVAKKGFAAGKELNAEGKAIYDKLVKEGVKPKSALNKALFRQEKVQRWQLKLQPQLLKQPSLLLQRLKTRSS